MLSSVTYSCKVRDFHRFWIQRTFQTAPVAERNSKLGDIMDEAFGQGKLIAA